MSCRQRIRVTSCHRDVTSSLTLSWLCPALKGSRGMLRLPLGGVHPTQTTFPAGMVLSAPCAGGSDSPQQHQGSRARCCHGFHYSSTTFAHERCMSSELGKKKKKKGLALFSETYLSPGQNSWLLFLDDSRKLLSNLKQRRVLAHVSPHLCLCQNVSFA